MMPLEGIRVLDLTRQAPGPYCTMLLGHLRADVIIVEEAPGAGRRMEMGMSERAQAHWALNRNKRSVGLNLKDPRAQEAFLKLAEDADVVIEGFRPGGVTSLLAFPASQYFAAGMVPNPGVEMLNGGAPYYSVYETKDGKWLSIGCIEPWFWSELCKALDCEEYIPHQMNREKHTEIFEALRTKFKEKTRDEWFEQLRQRDICVGPVYSLDEVFEDPHVKARGMVTEVQHPEFGPVKQVGVGPKFSDTPGAVRTTAPKRGEHTADLLRDAGYSDAEIEEIKAAGIAG